MARVNSTAIRRVRAGAGRTLIEFHSGDRYLVELPRNTRKALQKARSVGTFYNKEVKGKYPVRKISA